MSFEIKDGIYYAAAWMIENHPRGNWLGAVFREEGGEWQFLYRWRLYKDDVLDETSEDEKSWQGFYRPRKLGESDEAIEREMVEKIDLMVALISASGYGARPPRKVTPRSDRADVVHKALMRMMGKSAQVHLVKARGTG